MPSSGIPDRRRCQGGGAAAPLAGSATVSRATVSPRASATARVILTLAAALCLAGPGGACINDSDSAIQESRFLQAYAQLPDAFHPSRWNPVGIGASVVASMLIAATVYLAAKPTRRR